MDRRRVAAPKRSRMRTRRGRKVSRWTPRGSSSAFCTAREARRGAFCSRTGGSFGSRRMEPSATHLFSRPGRRSPFAAKGWWRRSARRSRRARWAVLGAASLVLLGLVPWPDALAAVGRGSDVYLFLAGMMLLAELARQQGVFDWLAALATKQARGSASLLFVLVFAVGTMVTA